uniref:C2CD3 N-terminal C2 domain-containing protein n=1 Tax=Pavo cristatus TaxID=9049 RepID=A0A8C9G1S4_PAVCR
CFSRADITTNTTLPPLVEGPPRCVLRCTVGRIVWTAAKPPSAAVLVRLRWWGETSDGTVFHPASKPGQAAGSSRYAVRCGPRQLAAYLTDMGMLVLEVLTKPDRLPVGRVQITELSQLSPSHPISGFFTIASPTADKLGELQVFLMLLLTVLFRSWGKDHSFFQESSENIKDVSSASHRRLVLADERLKANPSSQQSVSFPSSADPEAPLRTNTHVFSLHNPTTTDLLSALLDQGNKLRDAMVASVMKSSPDMEIELNEVPPFVKPDGFRAAISWIIIHKHPYLTFSSPLSCLSSWAILPHCKVEELWMGNVTCSRLQGCRRVLCSCRLGCKSVKAVHKPAF